MRESTTRIKEKYYNAINDLYKVAGKRVGGKIVNLSDVPRKYKLSAGLGSSMQRLDIIRRSDNNKNNFHWNTVKAPDTKMVNEVLNDLKKACYRSKAKSGKSVNIEKYKIVKTEQSIDKLIPLDKIIKAVTLAIKYDVKDITSFVKETIKL